MSSDDPQTLLTTFDGREPPEKQVPLWVKTGILVLELVFIGGLLATWLLSDAVRESKNLWILFFYSFPSEFLIAPVPHEPIFFYFGKYYSPLVVAAVSVSSTVLTEALNYHIFGYFADRKFFDRVHRSRITRKVISWFNKSPFWTLIIVGLSPIPFYPLRFLVVLAGYPIWKYCLAVLISRAPRFYLLSWLGAAVQIPNWLLVTIFAVLILAINVPLVVGLVRNRKVEGEGGEEDQGAA